MSADCGKLKNFNCFRRAHKGDFPKFGHKYIVFLMQTNQSLSQVRDAVDLEIQIYIYRIPYNGNSSRKKMFASFRPIQGMFSC